MKKSAKSLISVMLVLVMLFSSFVIFSVSGSAASEEIAIFINNDGSKQYLTWGAGDKLGNEWTSDSEQMDVYIAAPHVKTGIDCNGQIKNIFAGFTGKVAKFGLSFRLSAQTKAFMKSSLRFQGNNNSGYQTLFQTDTNGDVYALACSDSVYADRRNKIGNLADGPLDIVLDYEITWSDTLGETNGTLAVTAYVNGECKGAFETTTAHTGFNSSALYFYARGQDNRGGNITAANGVQLTKRASETQRSPGETMHKDDPVVYSNNPVYYAITLFEDFRAYSGSARTDFVYPGASMRLKDDSASSGLRFTFGVDKAWYDSLAQGARTGAVIIPTDKLPNGFGLSELAKLTEGEDYVEMYADGFCDTAPEAVADESTYVYYASLVNIREKNYTRSFTAVGFVELANGTRVYTNSQSRSIYEVAKNATISGNYENTENESKIDAYLDKVVSLDASFAVEAIENYDCSIVGAASGNGFTLTGEGVDKIQTIILNGVSYTDGWTVEGNVLTVENYVAD